MKHLLIWLRLNFSKIRIKYPALLTLSLILALCLAEIGFRFFHNIPFQFENVLKRKLDLFLSTYPAEYDQVLGWIPKRGNYGRSNVWNTQVLIEPNGFRSNGPKTSKLDGSRKVILAVGDSFTFGDQVSDDETWPAYLEAMTGVKVINAGVFGYGVDQIILRTESVFGPLKPTWVILSFIPDDIQRCELSARTCVHKPYFTLTKGLTLHNVPVPLPNPAYRRLGPLRLILGYSSLADFLMMTYFRSYWLSGLSLEQRVHNQGVEVTCALFSRFERFLKTKKVNGLVVIQMPKNLRKNELKKIKAVREYLNQTSLHVLDLHEPLMRLKKSDSRKYKQFFTYHMTPEGNKWVAEQIVVFLGPSLQFGGERGRNERKNH